MTKTKGIRRLLTVQTLLLCSSVVLSSDDPVQNSKSNIDAVRKRIDEHSVITEEAKSDVEIGRQYLESLWDSVEKNHERKLEDRGRMPYLDSMMSVLSMDMSMPSKAPSNSQPSKPAEPTQAKPTPSPIGKPTPSPVSGPTLPTREPIPTRAPIPPPSTERPIGFPTFPNPNPTPTASLPPLRPCIEAEKEVYLREALSRSTPIPLLLDATTPQGMAYSFLLTEEPSFVCSPTLMQRYGLSTFYFATGGETWTNNGGWLKNKHECNWFGVECNDEKFVISINLGK